jgi:hypothetical protein
MREINADSGGVIQLLKAMAYRVPCYAQVADQALVIALQYRSRLGGEGWEDRLCRERAAVPDELRSIVLDVTGNWPLDPTNGPEVAEFTKRQSTRQAANCPPAWAALSVEYAHPFVHVLRPELKDPGSVSALPLSLDYLAGHPLVKEVFARNNIVERGKMTSLLQEAARSRPGRFLTPRNRLLIEGFQSVAAGKARLSTHTDMAQPIPQPTWAPSPLIDELIQSLSNVGAEIARTVLDDTVARARNLIAEGLHVDATIALTLFQQTYQWSGDSWAWLAIAQSAEGNREGARYLMIKALALEPERIEFWRLLISILGSVPQDSAEAEVVSKFISGLTAARPSSDSASSDGHRN